jgi:hypothetical protein
MPVAGFEAQFAHDGRLPINLNASCCAFNRRS